MSPLSTIERTGMARDAAVTLLDTAEIRRRSAAGNWLVIATVPARLALTTSRAGERLAGAGSAAETDADASLNVPEGTDLRRGDHALVAGRTVETLYVKPTVRVHLRALCKVHW